MTIACGAFPVFTALCDISDITPETIVVTDTVGGTAIDVAIVDRNGTPAPWGGWTSVGVTVAGANSYTMNVCAAGMWGVGVRNHATGAVICYGGGGIASMFGDARLLIGQSLGSNMADLDDGTLTASIYTAMWRNGAWATPVGNGVKSFLNTLYGLTGVPQAIVMAAVGSTAVTLDGYNATTAALGAQNGWWLNTGATPWTTAASGIAAVSGRLSGVFHIAGESDSIGVSANLYLRALFALDANIQALTTRKAPQLRLGMMPIGFYAPCTAADPRPVLDAQRKFIELRPGAYNAGERWNLMRDSTNIHLTAAASGELGVIMAQKTFEQEYALAA